MAKKRYGGPKGRGGTRRRTRGRGRGYAGSARTAGRAPSRTARDLTVGVWK